MKYIKTFEQQEDKSKIIKLNLSDRNLTKLPDLSEYINLKELYCGYNNLTSLPELPESLEYLYCSYNNLTSLSKLPNSLRLLYCKNNNLTSLPELPKSLTTLICENNNLPYDNLVEYKEWKKDPEAWEAKKLSKKYNL